MKSFKDSIEQSIREELLSEGPGKYSKTGDKLKYQWGDINQALMNAGANPRVILNVLTGLSKKEVK